MQQRRNRRHQAQSDTAAFDPVALTVALWLGLLVSIAALGRMSAQAAAQANMDEVRGVTPVVTNPIAAGFPPYGG